MAEDEEEVRQIDLPVSLDSDVLELSDVDRLQESLKIVKDFMFESGHTPDEWLALIFAEDSKFFSALCVACNSLPAREAEFLTDKPERVPPSEQEVPFDFDPYAEPEEEDPSGFDTDDSETLPLGLLSEMLVLMISLRPSLLCPPLVQHDSFYSVLQSLDQSAKLSSRDVFQRLMLVKSVALHHPSVEIDDSCLQIILPLLASKLHGENQRCFDLCCEVVIYVVSLATNLQKSFLEALKSELSSDLLGQLSEFYFNLLNKVSNSVSNETLPALKLLLRFNSAVFRWRIDDFYFSSDVRVLVEMYVSRVHNCDYSTTVDSEALILILDALYNIVVWPKYSAQELSSMRSVSVSMLEAPKVDPSAAASASAAGDPLRAGLGLHKIDEIREVLKKLTEDITENWGVIDGRLADFDVAASSEVDAKSESDEDSEEFQQELAELTRLTRLFDTLLVKVRNISETLDAVESGEFDFDKGTVHGSHQIEIPIDLSVYALQTKNASLLQGELVDLIEYFTGEGGEQHSEEEWQAFVTDEGCLTYMSLCQMCDRLLEVELGDSEEMNEEWLLPLTSLARVLQMLSSLKPELLVPLLFDCPNVLDCLIRSLRHSIENGTELKPADSGTRLRCIATALLDIVNCACKSDSSTVDRSMARVLKPSRLIEWVESLLVVCERSEIEDSVEYSSLCITHCVAAAHCFGKGTLAASLCRSIPSSLSTDALGRFTEFFIAKFSGADWSESPLSRLSSAFLQCVWLNEVELFFVSDEQLLVEVLERLLKDCEPKSGALSRVLLTWEVLFRSERYSKVLGRHRVSEVNDVLISLMMDLFEDAPELTELIKRVLLSAAEHL